MCKEIGRTAGDKEKHHVVRPGHGCGSPPPLGCSIDQEWIKRVQAGSGDTQWCVNKYRRWLKRQRAAETAIFDEEATLVDWETAVDETLRTHPKWSKQ